MNHQKYNDSLNCSRRNFLKYPGIRASAFTLGYMALPSNAGEASMAYVTSDEHDTDVLIVGGGIAATFAAIKARQPGVKVTLVDKGIWADQTDHNI